MAFYLLNRTSTFIPIDLASKTIMLRSREKLGPFPDSEMTDDIRTAVRLNLVTVEPVADAPKPAPKKKQTKELPKEIHDHDQS